MDDGQDADGCDALIGPPVPRGLAEATVLEISARPPGLTAAWRVKRRITVEPRHALAALDAISPGTVDVAILDEAVSAGSTAAMFGRLHAALKPGGRLHVIELRSTWPPEALRARLVGCGFAVQALSSVRPPGLFRRARLIIDACRS